MDQILRQAARTAPFRAHATLLHLHSEADVQFLDITDRVRAETEASGVTEGIVNVQTCHTTTGVVVNENEPMLLEDLADALERWAPRGARYRHDHPGLRTAPLGPDERINGHSHARALALGASASLNVVGGRLQLGRWQRILFVELDGPQARTVSLLVLGAAGRPPAEGRLPAPVRALAAGEARP